MDRSVHVGNAEKRHQRRAHHREVEERGRRERRQIDEVAHLLVERPARGGEHLGQVHEDQLDVVSRPANRLRDVAAEVGGAALALRRVRRVVSIIAVQSHARRQLEVLARRDPLLDLFSLSFDGLTAPRADPSLDRALDLVVIDCLVLDIAARANDARAAHYHVVAVGRLKVPADGPHAVAKLLEERLSASRVGMNASPEIPRPVGVLGRTLDP